MDRKTQISQCHIYMDAGCVWWLGKGQGVGMYAPDKGARVTKQAGQELLPRRVCHAEIGGYDYLVTL
jgi:hypothetical protein